MFSRKQLAFYQEHPLHPTAEWMLQQFREAIPGDHEYKFVIHDRDSIFSGPDNELKSFGWRVLRTPVQASKANAYCERLIGTIQREFLDWVIPLSEKHLRRMLREWGCTLQSRTPTCKSGTRDSRTDDRATAKPKASEARAAAGLSNKNKGRTRPIAS